MRGEIVVPDDINAVVEWSPIMASECEELSPARYKSAKAPGGLTVEQAVAGIHRGITWATAAFDGVRYDVPERSVLPRKGLERLMQKACDRLERSLKRSGKLIARDEFVPLPKRSYDGMIGLRAQTITSWCVVTHQVYVYHLRRAFYTFDRDSGFMFPGGDRRYLKLHNESILRTLCPI